MLVQKRLDVRHDGGMVDELGEEGIIFEDVEDAGVGVFDLGATVVGLTVLCHLTPAIDDDLEPIRQTGGELRRERILYDQETVALESFTFVLCRMFTHKTPSMVLSSRQASGRDPALPG